MNSWKQLLASETPCRRSDSGDRFAEAWSSSCSRPFDALATLRKGKTVPRLGRQTRTCWNAAVAAIIRAPRPAAVHHRRRRSADRMLINLLPDFFAILDSTDRIAAYRSYFESHRRLLQAYWHNYVIDPDSPHFVDVVRSTVMADRGDLRAMLERTDVVSLMRDAETRCRDLLHTDVDFDVVLMV